MSPHRKRKSHNRDYGLEPWWVKEFGGMPGWSLVAAGFMFLAIAAVIVYALAVR